MTMSKTPPETTRFHLKCSHYKRNCEILTPCCGTFFPCRVCHDEFYQDGQSSSVNLCRSVPMNRHQITTVRCTECSTIQPKSQRCVSSSCAAVFGDYYCAVCALWQLQPNKDIYHCTGCGICRIGKGLGVDFFHCTTCNACLDISLKASHNCVERTLESNCPMCLEFMFTSRDPVAISPCGHAMHHKCLQLYVRDNRKCPICMKSLLRAAARKAQVQGDVPPPNDNGARGRDILDNEVDVPAKFMTQTSAMFIVMLATLLLHYCC